MKLSARNQLPGKVAKIEHGDIMSSVKVDIGGGHVISAVVTRDAVEELGLKEGSPVTALVKATSVMLMQ